MTTNPWEDSDEGNNQQDQAKGLRGQLERALAENKALKERADKAEAAYRQTTIAAVLKEKGVNPKVAKLLPNDLDPTEDAVTKWLEDFGDVFAPKAPDAAPDNAQGDDGTNAELAAQMAKLAGVTDAGKPPAKDSDLLAKLNDPNLTQDKLIELINAAGGGYGVG